MNSVQFSDYRVEPPATGKKPSRASKDVTRDNRLMGMKERQDREREAVRRAILNAARDLFVSDGYQNVSLRKIAERIEYSPAAIYGYFESKDDIFFALAEEGFRLLFCGGTASTADLPPLDAVRRQFWHFYEFSKTHPEYFALMFVDRAVPRISRDWERFGFVREMKRAAGDTIRRCIAAGLLPPDTSPDAVFRILSSAIYGVAVFRLSDRLAPGEDPDALAHDTLEAALAGLQSGIPITFHAGRCEDAEPASVPERAVTERADAPQDPGTAPREP